MKILGNRILVSKVEEPKSDGFQAVEVEDSFVYKGKVEQVKSFYNLQSGEKTQLNEGDIVLFAKYCPHTQEVEVDGQKMKIIRVEDVLAVL